MQVLQQYPQRYFRPSCDLLLVNPPPSTDVAIIPKLACMKLHVSFEATFLTKMFKIGLYSVRIFLFHHSSILHYSEIRWCRVIVCPLGAVWAYYIKVPYLLVRHHKQLCMQLNKVTLLFFWRLPSKLKGARGEVRSRRPRYYVPCSI